MTDLEELYRQILKGKEVRKNLIAIRQGLEDETARRKFMYFLGAEFDPLTGLLGNEDPKVRRNAALILGMTEDEDVLPEILDAWEKEQTLYVREDYLKAIQMLDYRACLPKLRAALERLSAEAAGGDPAVPGSVPAGTSEIAPDSCRSTAAPRDGSSLWDNNRHIGAELLRLKEMIRKYERRRRHRFIRQNPAPDLILMANRCQSGITAGQIQTGEVKTLAGGVHVRGGDLNEISRIRTWSECLFTVPGAKPVRGNEKQIAEGLHQLRIGSYLRSLHEEDDQSFLYRIELKSGSMEREKRGPFIRKVAASLDLMEQGLLENSDSDYEAEIRLIERKDGSYAVLLKLFTVPDTRFAYRVETDAQGMAPVNAALCVQLALPWLKEGAQVLDPFCGTGTLLIERKYAKDADPVYGVDRQGEVIRKARINTERFGKLYRAEIAKEDRPVRTGAEMKQAEGEEAGENPVSGGSSRESSSSGRRIHTDIYYINRDFFDFRHDYPFDEILTEFPRLRDDQTDLFARRFLQKSSTLLAEAAVVIVITDAPRSLVRAADAFPAFVIEEQFPINERTGTTEIVLKYLRNR